MAEFSSNIGEGLIKAAQELDKGRKEIFKEAMAAADTIDKAGSEIDKTLKKTKKKLEETELQLNTLKVEVKNVSAEVNDANIQQELASAIEKAANAKPAEIKAKARINTYIDSSSLKGQSKDILDEVQGILEKAMSIKGTKSQWKGFNLLKVLDVDDLNVDALEKKLKKLFNKKDFGDKPLDDKQLTAMFSAYQTLGGQKFKGYEDLEGYISSLTKVKNGGEFYQSIINATKELIPLLQAANSETEKLQKNTSKTPTPTGLKSGKTTGGSTSIKSDTTSIDSKISKVEQLNNAVKELISNAGDYKAGEIVDWTEGKDLLSIVQELDNYDVLKSLGLSEGSIEEEEGRLTGFVETLKYQHEEFVNAWNKQDNDGIYSWSDAIGSNLRQLTEYVDNLILSYRNLKDTTNTQNQSSTLPLAEEQPVIESNEKVQEKLKETQKEAITTQDILKETWKYASKAQYPGGVDQEVIDWKASKGDDVSGLITKEQAVENLNSDLSVLAQNGSEGLNQLKERAKELEASLSSVSEAVSRISKMSSIKDIPYDNFADEATEISKRLATLYDEGIRDSEEFVALQYKIMKLLDEESKNAGGVKSSGANSAGQLRTWIMNSWKRQNADFDIESLVDIVFGGKGGSVSVIDETNGKLISMKNIVATISNYGKSGWMSFEHDTTELKELNAIIEYVEKNLTALQQIGQKGIISESNKQEIASNEEVIASEEKKRKLKIANKDYLANRQEAQSSTETADIIVVNNERTQESANKTAQVVEDAANRIVAAEEKIAEGSKKKNKGLNTLLDEHSKPISDNVQALIDKKLSEIKDTVALDGNAKYKITTDADDSPVGVNITYKDKDTQSMITEMYSFKAATEETEEEYEGLVLKRKEYSKDEIKLAEQRVQSEKKTQKEIERSDSFLEKQKRTITNIQQLYDKDINPNAQKGITNVSDLKDLRDTYSSILEKINALKGTKVSQSIKDDLLSQINDFENKRKSYTAKWYGATDLSPKELSVNKDILTNNFDAFISEAKLAGTYTSDLVIKVEEFKKTINSIDSSVGLKTAKDQLMEYRSELKALIQEERVRISQEKANKSDYNENYKTIQNYEAAQDKLNKLLGQQAKGNSSNELKEKIKIAKQEVFDLKIEAIEASKAITSMFKSGSISKDQKTNAQSLLKNVNLGNTDSSSTLAATLNDSLSKHDVEIIDITAKYEKLGYTTDEITEKFKKLNTAQQEANNSSNSSVDERLQKELKYQEELNKLKIEASQIKDGTKENTSSSVQNALKNTQQLMSQFANSDMTGFDRVFTDAQSKVNELNKYLQTGKISTETYTKKIQEIASGMSKVVGIVNPNNITQAEEAMRNYASTFKNVDIKKFNDEAGTLTFRFEEQKGVIKEVTLQYDQMTGAISKVKEVTTTAQTGLQSFLSSLKGRAKALVQYLATFASFYRIIAIIRQGIAVIKDLDTALTEMRKVSNESVKSLKEFQKVSFDVANSIGSTAKQIQESAADFMRLGYELNTASELAKDANIYANVGDMEIGEATEHMISSIQAWKSEFSNEVEASAAIIDRYNEIGNNFAITSADIGSAMERSAAALKAGGKVYCHDI